MAELLARAVVVTDAEGRVVHTELVPEITQEPDLRVGTEGAGLTRIGTFASEDRVRHLSKLTGSGGCECSTDGRPEPGGPQPPNGRATRPSRPLAVSSARASASQWEASTTVCQ